MLSCNFNRKSFFAAVALTLSVIATSAEYSAAQSGAPLKPPLAPLPRDPAMWINSPPIKPEALEGKAAFIWFYEEQCPRCAAKWPELIAISKKFEGKPIVFIAVNSGNSRLVVEQYIRQKGVTWPVIVDPTREVEKAFEVRDISLQNIMQVKVVYANGRIDSGDWNDLAATADKALAGAKWNIEPGTVPAALRPAWSAIEFGDYAAGATLVKKGLTAGKPEIKAAAEKLNEYVAAKIIAEVAQAGQEVGPWAGYQGYQRVSERFAGYELPPEVNEKVKQLSADEQVKKQLAAQKLLATIKKALASQSPTGRKGALGRLKKFSADHAGTDAATEAQSLLQQLGAQQ